jgi:cytochrome c-type biogenesis protein CcmF
MFLGNLSLTLAFIASVFSALLFLAGRKGEEKFLKPGRKTYYIFFFLTSVASAYLLYLFLSHHFEVEYVYGYSSSDLPLFYLISSFWAGQEGTFLLWLFLGAFLGIFIMRKSGTYEGYTMTFFLLIQIFLLTLLLKKSPFSVLPFSPEEGRGLNPLLQDFWMVIHPPVVFLGYAALGVPFSFALAALAKDEYKDWVRCAFPWAVFSCLSLGAGIFLGGFWSYKVLGWGGYWGWDPVENASLVPWILSIALVHGFLMEKIKGSMPRTNFLLAILCFVLVLYAAFLTRSGILGDFSVHSFVDLGINAYLVLFIMFFILLSSGLFLYRLSGIRHVEATRNLISSEFSILLAIIFLSLSAVMVLLGTSAPIITRLFGQPSNVSTTYYVNTQLPLAIILAAILGFAPHLKFRGSSWSDLKKTLFLPLFFALVLTLLAFALKVRFPAYLIFLFVSLFALAGNLLVFVKKSKAGLKFLGGYLAHFGVGLMFLGIITSSGYSRSIKINLPQDEPGEALGYNFTYLGMEEDLLTDKNSLKIKVEKGGRNFLARPKFYYSEYTQSIMATPHIKVNLLEDIYLAPVEHVDAEEAGKTTFTLRKGETKTIQGYTIKFLDFDMSTHQMGSQISVGATLEVEREGKVDTLTPFISMDESGQQQFQETVYLPGRKHGLVLEQIDADRKMIKLSLLAQEDEPQKNLLVLEVSKKPLINLLWLGTALIMLGLAISTYRRTKELKAKRR